MPRPALMMVNGGSCRPNVAGAEDANAAGNMAIRFIDIIREAAVTIQTISTSVSIVI